MGFWGESPDLGPYFLCCSPHYHKIGERIKILGGCLESRYCRKICTQFCLPCGSICWLYLANWLVTTSWSLSILWWGVGVIWTVICVCAQSCLTLYNPMDCRPPASLVHGISRQEYWSGLPFPSPGDLPNPGIEPKFSCIGRQIFYTVLPGLLFK